MSNTPDFGFGKFVPGFDFLQQLAQAGAGWGQALKAAAPAAPLSPLGQWVAPTLSVEDLDKRIQELKAVQFWLEQNTVALKATIQALEVQRMTLQTLQGMNVSMGDLARAFQPATAAASSPASSGFPFGGASAAASSSSGVTAPAASATSAVFSAGRFSEDQRQDDARKAFSEGLAASFNTPTGSGGTATYDTASAAVRKTSDASAPLPPRSTQTRAEADEAAEASDSGAPSKPRARAPSGSPRPRKAKGLVGKIESGVVDPGMWWGSLVNQFQQIAQGAMQDLGASAKPLAASPTTDAPSSTARKAAVKKPATKQGVKISAQPASRKSSPTTRASKASKAARAQQSR